MFRFIKRIVILCLLLGTAALLAAVFLPNTCRIESTVIIAAAKVDVFERAKDIQDWHLIAMYGDFPTNPDLTRGTDPWIDSMVSKARRGAENLKVRYRVVRLEAPDLIIYEVDGGPIHGLAGEIVMVKENEYSTKAILKEELRFSGFFGSLKAVAARLGGSHLQNQSLENLKRICEKTTS